MREGDDRQELHAPSFVQYLREVDSEVPKVFGHEEERHREAFARLCLPALDAMEEAAYSHESRALLGMRCKENDP